MNKLLKEQKEMLDKLELQAKQRLEEAQSLLSQVEEQNPALANALATALTNAKEGKIDAGQFLASIKQFV